MSRHESRLRTDRLFPGLALALALALTGCGSDEDAATSTDPAASDSPAPAGEETLPLTADGAAAAKCAVPVPDTLATFDTAFAGTVTALDDGTATLSVDEWYAGGDGADTVTVTSPSEQLQDLLLAVDFQEGRSYLVSADGDRVTLCGYSGEDNAEMQALYAEAFGG